MLILLILVLTFVCAVLLVLGLASPDRDRGALSQRIEAIARGTSDPLAMPSLADAHMNASFTERIGRPALRGLAGFSGRFTPKGALQTTRATLDKAGNPAGLGVPELMGLRALCALVFLPLAFTAPFYLGNTPLLKVGLFFLCLVIGASLPDALLQQKIGDRQVKIRKSLPDTIDLLIVSVEAGMGFDGAIAKVVEKVKGPLADEFARLLQEMRLGKTRVQGLKDLSARIDIPEITTLVASICQADQLGVSIANVLRVQSDTIRVLRIQQVRELAAKLPVKMLFPLVFCIFPSIFIALIGPSLITTYEALSKM